MGGVAYAGLKKGTAPYANGLAQVSAARTASLALGVPYRVTAVTTIHGESDHLLGASAALYESYHDPKYRCCPLLRKKVQAGHLGAKSGRGFHDYPQV